MPRTTISEILWETLQTSQQPHTTSVYDEVLRDVSARVAEQESIGKADIGALVVWKRLNASTTWARNLMETPEEAVRTITGRAYALANDLSVPVPIAGGTARDALLELPGMGGEGAIASAVLLSMSPNRMAVWDKRVEEALTAIGKRPKDGLGRYERYLYVVLDLATQMQAADDQRSAVIPRQVDLALFHAGGDSRLLEVLREAADR